jgi:hypothetical protein
MLSIINSNDWSVFEIQVVVLFSSCTVLYKTKLLLIIRLYGKAYIVISPICLPRTVTKLAFVQVRSPSGVLLLVHILEPKKERENLEQLSLSN